MVELDADVFPEDTVLVMTSVVVPVLSCLLGPMVVNVDKVVNTTTEGDGLVVWLEGLVVGLEGLVVWFLSSALGAICAYEQLPVQEPAAAEQTATRKVTA